MATLFLVTKSPFVHNDPREAVETAMLQKEIEEKVGVVFLQDAVLGVRREQTLDDHENETFEKLLLHVMGKGVRIYVLEADLRARAIFLENVIDNVEAINYPQLIDLIMEEYKKIVSWT